MKQTKTQGQAQRWVASYTQGIFRLRQRLLPLIILPVLLMASGWYYFQADLSTESFLFEQDPAVRVYKQIQENYGSQDIVIIAAQAGENGVFDAAYLEKLQRFTADIEDKLPFVDEITSILNATDIKAGSAGELITEDLLEGFPDQMQTSMADLQSYVLAQESYVNFTIDKDASASAVLVRLAKKRSAKEVGETETASLDQSENESEDLDALFDDVDDAGPEAAASSEGGDKQQGDDSQQSDENKLSNADYSLFYKDMRQLITEYNAPGFELHAAGFPILEPGLLSFMLQDIFLTLGLILTAIISLLLLSFRRKQALLPLPVIGMSLLSAGGLMFFTGVPLTLITMIMPSILVAISVGAGIHLLSHFFRLYDSGMQRKEALLHAMQHCALPIVLTGITTAGGMASFIFSDLKPLHDFGIFGAIGVLFSTIFTLCFIPCILSFAPLQRRALKNTTLGADAAHEHLKQKHNYMDSFLHWCSNAAYKRPYLITVISLTSIIGAIYTASHVQLHHRPLDWLPDSAAARLDSHWMDQKFGGSNVVNVIINTGEAGGIYEPEFLRSVEKFEQFVLSYNRDGLKPGAVSSVTTLYRKINMVLHEDNEAFRRLPDTRELAAQEMLLFESSGADDLSRMVNTDHSEINILIKVPDLDAVPFARLLKTLESHLKQEFAGTTISYHVNGNVALLVRVIEAALSSMLKSYGFAMLIITFLMMIFLRSVGLGLLSMLPNFVPLFVMASAMTLLHIDLDLFITMTGSLVLGLAVDDTIHFMSTFLRLRKEDGLNTQEAILLTLSSSGRAMVQTSLIIIGGFATFLLGQMNNLKHFSILASIAITTALLCDLLFTPALMVIIERISNFFKEKKGKKEKQIQT